MEEGKQLIIMDLIERHFKNKAVILYFFDCRKVQRKNRTECHLFSLLPSDFPALHEAVKESRLFFMKTHIFITGNKCEVSSLKKRLSNFF